MDELLEKKFLKRIDDYIKEVDLELNDLVNENGSISESNDYVINSYKALLLKKIYAGYIKDYFFKVGNNSNKNIFVGFKFLLNNLLCNNGFSALDIKILLKYYSSGNDFSNSKNTDLVGPSVLLIDYNNLLDMDIRVLEYLARNFHEETLLLSKKGKNKYTRFINQEQYIDAVNKIGLYLYHDNTYNFKKFVEALSFFKVNKDFINNLKEKYIELHLKRNSNPIKLYLENEDLFDTVCVDDKQIISELIHDVLERIYICNDDEYIMYKLLINEYLNLLMADHVDLSKISRLK